MPSGWIYGHTDRGLYIVQSSQKEKREGDVRLWRLFAGQSQNVRVSLPHCNLSMTYTFGYKVV
jgi:hypothetical protein